MGTGSRGLISPDSIYQTQGGDGLMHSVRTVNIDRSRSGWKFITLEALSIIFAAGFGYSFAAYLAGDFSFWFVLGALLLWSAFATLEGFLQKDISRRFLVILLEALALIAFFYTYAWQALALTLILVALCLLWGYLSVRRELRNTIEVRFFTASGKVIGKVVTAAVVFMVVMYAALTNNNGNFFVSPTGFDTFFNWTAGFVNSFYPSLPLGGSFGEFSEAVAKMQLQNEPAYQNLTQTEKDIAITQAADQIAATFSGASSTPAGNVVAPIASTTLAETTNVAFYNYLAALTAKLQDKFGTAFVGVWGLILFLILRSVGIVVVWLAQFVSLVFYEILLAAGFLRIAEEPATKEVFEY